MQKFGERYSYFSTGDFFRAICNGGENAIGKYVKDKINAGELIPDEVTIQVFHTYFHTLENKRMLLDGYPRSIEQIDDLLAVGKKHNRSYLAIDFVLSEEKAIERMLERGRTDDTQEAIKRRLEQYYEKTQPLVDYFAQHGELISINADDTIENIFSQVEVAIQK